MIKHPSPNFGPRRGGVRPDLIVLHYTSMDSCDAAAERLSDPACEVSAHYLIDEDGMVLHLVEEELRAWHAGAGGWGGITDVNSQSIGIELSNIGTVPFAGPQMLALEVLLPKIMRRWDIPPERIIGHSDMAPGRKFDPGGLFDWQRLAGKGLSIWPDTQADVPVDEAAFLADITSFGYPEAPFDVLLAAFRLRFRPAASGALDATDCAMAHDLAQRFPVDRTRASA